VLYFLVYLVYYHVFIQCIWCIIYLYR